jgi:hypothetical protein
MHADAEIDEVGPHMYTHRGCSRFEGSSSRRSRVLQLLRKLVLTNSKLAFIFSCYHMKHQIRQHCTTSSVASSNHFNVAVFIL